MFICANCKKEKPDAEQSSVGLLGNIGFILIAKVPWWPAKVCGDCRRQVRLFGVACILIFVILAFVFLNR